MSVASPAMNTLDRRRHLARRQISSLSGFPGQIILAEERQRLADRATLSTPNLLRLNAMTPLLPPSPAAGTISAICRDAT
jgi:hypothetical protein